MKSKEEKTKKVNKPLNEPDKLKEWVAHHSNFLLNLKWHLLGEKDNGQLTIY